VDQPFFRAEIAVRAVEGRGRKPRLPQCSGGAVEGVGAGAGRVGLHHDDVVAFEQPAALGQLPARATPGREERRRRQGERGGEEEEVEEARAERNETQEKAGHGSQVTHYVSQIGRRGVVLLGAWSAALRR
jgi:hypothetical protein